MFIISPGLLYFSLSLSAIVVAIIRANSVASIYIIDGTTLASFSCTGGGCSPFHARLDTLKFNIVVLDIELPYSLSVPHVHPSLLLFLTKASDGVSFRGAFPL